MSAEAVGLVLAASLLHAFWNARTHSGEDRAAALAIAYAVGAVWMAPWLIADPPLALWWLVILNGLAHGGYLLSLSASYARGSLATTYPIARGSAPLLIAAVGIWVLDQQPSSATVFGAFAVAFGLGLIGNVGWRNGERHSMVLALTAGCFIASYTLLDARGAQEVHGWSFFAASSVVAVLVVIVGANVSWARLVAARRTGLLVGVASSAAYALVLLAYTRADAANVATMRSTSILFGLLLAPQVITGRLLTGTLLTVVGVGLVALA